VGCITKRLNDGGNSGCRGRLRCRSSSRSSCGKTSRWGQRKPLPQRFELALQLWPELDQVLELELELGYPYWTGQSREVVCSCEEDRVCQPMTRAGEGKETGQRRYVLYVVRSRWSCGVRRVLGGSPVTDRSTLLTGPPKQGDG
jgi:hypothetical protein